MKNTCYRVFFPLRLLRKSIELLKLLFFLSYIKIYTFTSYLFCTKEKPYSLWLEMKVLSVTSAVFFFLRLILLAVMHFFNYMIFCISGLFFNKCGNNITFMRRDCWLICNRKIPKLNKYIAFKRDSNLRITDWSLLALNYP